MYASFLCVCLNTLVEQIITDTLMCIFSSGSRLYHQLIEEGDAQCVWKG